MWFNNLVSLDLLRCSQNPYCLYYQNKPKGTLQCMLLFMQNPKMWPGEGECLKKIMFYSEIYSKCNRVERVTLAKFYG